MTTNTTDDNYSVAEISTEKPKAKPRGKPFVKGDPRCWRLGRPKNIDQVRELSQAIWHEKAYTSDRQPIIIDGHHATNLEVRLRQMITSKDWRQVQVALEYGFGKVPNVITGPDGHDLFPVANVVALFQSIGAATDGDTDKTD